MPRNDGIIRLSPSVAFHLATVCPRSGWAKHRLLGNLREETASNLEGKLWHAAVLGAEDGEVKVLDYDSFRAKDAREARDKAHGNGQIPVVRAKWEEEYVPYAQCIRDEMTAEGVPLDLEDDDVHVEERLEWVERASNGNEVQCSGVIDYRRGFDIRDMKSHGKVPVTEHVARREIEGSHAILQLAAYPRALSQTYGVDYERISIGFDFFTTQPPIIVTPVKPSGEMQHAAELMWQRAIDVWDECLTNGVEAKHWPGPAPGNGKRLTVHASGWLVAKELEEEEYA